MRGETIKISLKGHLMAFRWRPDDGLSLNYGLLSLQFFRESCPVLLRKPVFSDLSGGTGPTSLPPLDPLMPVKKFSAISGRFLV